MMNAQEERPEMMDPEAGSTGGPPPPQAIPPQPPGGAPAPQTGWPGPAVGAVPDPRRKSPLLAGCLSLMPGLGQVYVGYYRLGFIHMIVFGTTIALLANEVFPPLIPLFSIFLGFFFLYNVVDAIRRASFYNQALSGMAGVEMPTEMSLPLPGGSVAGGVVLVVVGLILLSNTLFEYELDWLEDWWPVAPVLFGAWLIFRGMQERAKND